MPPTPTAILQGPSQVTIHQVAIYDGSRSRTPGGARSWSLFVGTNMVISGAGAPPSAIPATYTTLGPVTVRLEIETRTGARASASIPVIVLSIVTDEIVITVFDALLTREQLSRTLVRRLRPLLQVQVSDVVQFAQRVPVVRQVHVTDTIVLP